MVFGADWDEPLTPEEMTGRAFTSDELRAHLVIPSRINIETVHDESVCDPCRLRDGKPLYQGDPIEHPQCENQNGCRCVARVTAL